VRERILASSRPKPFRLPVWSLAVAAALLLAVVLPRLPWDRLEHPKSVAGKEAPSPASPLSPPSPAIAGAPAQAPPAAAPEAAPEPALLEKALKSKREGKEARASKGDEYAARKDTAGRLAKEQGVHAARDELRFAEAQDAPREAQASSAAPESAPSSPDAFADAASHPAGAEAAPEAKRQAPEDTRRRAPSPASAALPSAARPASPSESGLAKPAPGLDLAPAGVPDPTEAEYATLLRREAEGHGRVSADLRSLRRDWRSFLARNPHGPRGDDARVRVVALGVEIARASGEARDAEEALRDGRAYLERADAAQKERVHSLLAGLPR
jgi:hypothetical protein